jgi:hypothetical protein
VDKYVYIVVSDLLLRNNATLYWALSAKLQLYCSLLGIVYDSVMFGRRRVCDFSGYLLRDHRNIPDDGGISFTAPLVLLHVISFLFPLPQTICTDNFIQKSEEYI